jgi:lysozyme
MRMNEEGLALLEEFESFVGHAYPDPYSPLGKALRAAGLWRRYLKAPIPRSEMPESMRTLSGAPWTIGFGFTKDVSEGDRMTRAQGERRLAKELEDEYIQPILAACRVEPNPNELAAMACLAWNIGMGWQGMKKPKGAKDGFRQSSVLRAHNRGDKQAAARAFGLWNKAAGEVSPGLTRRRAGESALYLKPVDGDSVPMPQTVEPESNLARSPIISTATLSTGAGTLAVGAEAARSARDIRETIGDWLPWILVGVAVAAAGWAIWTRVKQRREGWA